MADFRCNFGPWVTDIHPNRVPSGTADVATNVYLDGTTLRGRHSFDGAYTISDDGATLVSMTTAAFNDGTIYVVVKVSNGSLWYKKLYPAADAWTEITDKYGGHHASDRGWWYFWADRLYYSDSNGVTKWHPTVGTFKAGVPISTTIPALTASLDTNTVGGKSGYYRIFVQRRNSLTGEVGLVAMNTDPVETRVKNDKGALTVSNWGTIRAGDTDWEHDQCVFYSTLNGTEAIRLGAYTREAHSYVAYAERYVATSNTNALYLTKSDDFLARQPRMRSAVGTPPVSKTGYFDGTRAVYGDVPALPSRIYVSVPYTPTMVPQDVTYEVTTGAALEDSTRLYAYPWEGRIPNSCGGPITGVGAHEGRFVLFTPTQTYVLVPQTNGGMALVQAHTSLGCEAVGGCVTTAHGVHALGTEAWLRFGKNGLEDVADNRFSTQLATIKAGARDTTVAAYYGFRDEVWMAVAGEDDDGPTRILVYDEPRQNLVAMYTPAGLNSETIVAMCELALPGTTPVMLVGLSDGRILRYPGTGWADYVSAGVTEGYACQWRGYFRTERRDRDLHFLRSRFHMENNANGITVGISAMEGATQAATTHNTQPITQADGIGTTSLTGLPNIHGSLMRVNITSDTSQTADWQVADLILEYE